MLASADYHNCCHSNLTRALAQRMEISLSEAERHVHDVLNVFMCTGFTRDEHRYFMKASPVRPGDFIEFFAEMDLIGALSACPGRGLRRELFQRRGALLSFEGRDFPTARRDAARLAPAAGQRLLRRAGRAALSPRDSLY